LPAFTFDGSIMHNGGQAAVLIEDDRITAMGFIAIEFAHRLNDEGIGRVQNH